jgi:hypothetical protein
VHDVPAPKDLPYGERLVLPQATGAELGLSIATVSSHRPNLIRDSNQTWEAAGGGKVNSYWFAHPGHEAQATQIGSDDEIVVAIVMEQTIKDSIKHEYGLRENAIRKQWTKELGPPIDSVTAWLSLPTSQDSTSIRTLLWTGPGVKAALELEIPRTRARSRPVGESLIRAVVQSRKVPFSVTLPSAASLDK